MDDNLKMYSEQPTVSTVEIKIEKPNVEESNVEKPKQRSDVSPDDTRELVLSGLTDELLVAANRRSLNLPPVSLFSSDDELLSSFSDRSTTESSQEGAPIREIEAVISPTETASDENNIEKINMPSITDELTNVQGQKSLCDYTRELVLSSLTDELLVAANRRSLNLPPVSLFSSDDELLSSFSDRSTTESSQVSEPKSYTSVLKKLLEFEEISMEIRNPSSKTGMNLPPIPLCLQEDVPIRETEAVTSPTVTDSDENNIEKINMPSVSGELKNVQEQKSLCDYTRELVLSSLTDELLVADNRRSLNLPPASLFSSDDELLSSFSDKSTTESSEVSKPKSNTSVLEKLSEFEEISIEIRNPSSKTGMNLPPIPLCLQEDVPIRETEAVTSPTVTDSDENNIEKINMPSVSGELKNVQGQKSLCDYTRELVLSSLTDELLVAANRRSLNLPPVSLFSSDDELLSSFSDRSTTESSQEDVPIRETEAVTSPTVTDSDENNIEKINMPSVSGELKNVQEQKSLCDYTRELVLSSLTDELLVADNRRSLNLPPASLFSSDDELLSSFSDKSTTESSEVSKPKSNTSVLEKLSEFEEISMEIRNPISKTGMNLPPIPLCLQEDVPIRETEAVTSPTVTDSDENNIEKINMPSVSGELKNVQGQKSLCDYTRELVLSSLTDELLVAANRRSLNLPPVSLFSSDDEVLSSFSNRSTTESSEVSEPKNNTSVLEQLLEFEEISMEIRNPSSKTGKNIPPIPLCLQEGVPIRETEAVMSPIETGSDENNIETIICNDINDRVGSDVVELEKSTTRQLRPKRRFLYALGRGLMKVGRCLCCWRCK
ncbi:uncharacterized protein LOC126549286 isoform X3 [Aphis gossypii]|uniref:uncharacterized protein LOC126549286 isoform X3 n=1 Tax=Aphis gossypii TaxID=80765 RepID=UPI002158BBB7|nr:uncharacterized protein LOC126549286 isoform X3 [Aphis gossypii]